MKRSSQGPPSKATSSGSTKIKDMQKAYGVSPKTSTTSKSNLKKSSETGEKVGGGVNATPSSQKLRGSVGSNLISSSKAQTEAGSSTTRKSYPPDAPTRTSSKILTASKANYAEKYGNTVGNSTTSSSGNKVAKGSIANKPSNRKAGGNSNSPYKRSPQKVSSIKSTNSSSTTSLLTNQKPPPALYESEAAEDYDEDFEEEYESDFEQANSTEDESEGPPASQIQSEPTRVNSINDDELDKSSSIREFEKLEKMVEVEEEQQLEQSIEYMKSNGNGGGSGEPEASNTILAKIVNQSGTINDDDDESSGEEDESEEDSLLPSPVVKKQNAFPVTGGFSISTSIGNEQPTLEQPRKSSVGYRKSEPIDDQTIVKTSLKGPRKENETQKRRRTNRGKIIQGMIKLDRVGVDIFHLVPYPYERFMAVFSGTDRLQTSTQTDQDRSVESVQTEPIDQTTKWTQKPPTWSTTSSSCDIRIVRQEALGVGSDDISEDLSPDQKIYRQFEFFKNWEQLSKFIIRASRKMLYVLEAEERIKLPSNSGKKGSLETIKMNRGLSVLSKLEMHTLAGDGECIGCANGAPFNLLEDNKENKTTNGNKKHTSKNLITVWSLKEPSMPLYFLRVWGHVSALKVHMIGRMIIAGNRDGSLNIWNLDESLCYHSQYQEQVIRTPSLNTSCMLPSHVLPIIGIEMFSDTKNTFSVVSIDKEGLIITWSCHRSHDTVGESPISQHSSAWSTIHISVRHQIQLDQITRDHLELTCFSAFLDLEGSTTGFYFGTFNGYVAKGQVVEDGSGANKAGNATANIVKYHERVDSNPKVICMDVSTTLNILAVGCEDGRCRLFEMSRKKLVLSLGGKQEPIRVKWSGRRASVLYVALKDSLLVWDLLTSDMNPWKTIHLKDIRDFVLYSPPHKEYLVVITGNDLIISTPAEEVRPLSSRDFARIQSYFSLLC